MAFQDEAKKRLFGQLPAAFVDPVTGYPPKCEVELSGLLGLFHQMGRITWNKVHLWLPNNTRLEETADILLGNTAICGEYQLFWESKEELNRWGSMPADLLCVSRDGQSVVIVENKIGSGFTGTGRDPATGQLARQVDFLSGSRVPKRSLVLLSGREFFEKHWYREEFEQTLNWNDRRSKVNGFLMQWEDIFSAIH